MTDRPTPEQLAEIPEDILKNIDDYISLRVSGDLDMDWIEGAFKALLHSRELLLAEVEAVTRQRDTAITKSKRKSKTVKKLRAAGNTLADAVFSNAPYKHGKQTDELADAARYWQKVAGEQNND